jgi:uncharacterized protein (TIGR04255 family)
MNWEPARADHSIDRATASLGLLNALDPNTFDDLIAAGRKVAAANNLANRIDATDAIELPSAPAGVIQIGLPNAAPRRVVFQRLDTANVVVDELSIGMQRIAIGTSRYRRWEDLYGFTRASILALDEAYPITRNVRSVRLDYLDSFQASRPEADHFEVISRESKFIVPAVREKTAALHVHSGWFDFESSNIRQLTNINIDVNEITVPGTADLQRRISILSLGQFEALAGTLERAIERLDGLHEYLKSTFRGIITKEAAVRVALDK